MYTPHHLRWLDAQKQHPDGYPEFVTEEAKKYLEAKVREVLAKDPDGFPLWILVEEVFDMDEAHKRPECIKRVGTYDAQYALVYRALLAVDAMNKWSLKGVKGQVDPDQVHSLKQALKLNFPETFAKASTGKKLGKKEQEHVACFVGGFANGLDLAGKQVNPVIHINLGCGRCDRFLKED